MRLYLEIIGVGLTVATIVAFVAALGQYALYQETLRRTLAPPAVPHSSPEPD